MMRWGRGVGQNVRGYQISVKRNKFKKSIVKHAGYR